LGGARLRQRRIVITGHVSPPKTVHSNYSR
jgi:hypothetical protein